MRAWGSLRDCRRGTDGIRGESPRYPNTSRRRTSRLPVVRGGVPAHRKDGWGKAQPESGTRVRERSPRAAIQRPCRRYSPTSSCARAAKANCSLARPRVRVALARLRRCPARCAFRLVRRALESRACDRSRWSLRTSIGRCRLLGPHALTVVASSETSDWGRAADPLGGHSRIRTTDSSVGDVCQYRARELPVFR